MSKTVNIHISNNSRITKDLTSNLPGYQNCVPTLREFHEDSHCLFAKYLWLFVRSVPSPSGNFWHLIHLYCPHGIIKESLFILHKSSPSPVHYTPGGTCLLENIHWLSKEVSGPCWWLLLLLLTLASIQVATPFPCSSIWGKNCWVVKGDSLGVLPNTEMYNKSKEAGSHQSLVKHSFLGGFWNTGCRSPKHHFCPSCHWILVSYLTEKVLLSNFYEDTTHTKRSISILEKLILWLR